jgi:hypothetical protein
MEPTHDVGNSPDAAFAWVAFSIHVRRSWFQILVRKPTVLTEAFRHFLYSLQATNGIVRLTSNYAPIAFLHKTNSGA